MAATEPTRAIIQPSADLEPIDQYRLLLDGIEPFGTGPKSVHTADPLHSYHQATIERITAQTDLPFLSCTERRGEHFAMYACGGDPAHLWMVLYLAGWSDTVERLGKERERKTSRIGTLECSRLADGIGSVISISVQGSVVALGTRAVAVLDQIVAQQQGGHEQ